MNIIPNEQLQEMMKSRPGTVTIEVLGHLIFFLPPEARHGTAARLYVEPGTTIEDVVSRIGIPSSEIGTVLVNGVSPNSQKDHLGPGDRVVIVPVIFAG